MLNIITVFLRLVSDLGTLVCEVSHILTKRHPPRMLLLWKLRLIMVVMTERLIFFDKLHWWSLVWGVLGLSANASNILLILCVHLNCSLSFERVIGRGIFPLRSRFSGFLIYPEEIEHGPQAGLENPFKVYFLVHFRELREVLIESFLTIVRGLKLIIQLFIEFHYSRWFFRGDVRGGSITNGGR